jgi:hypothetical protein
MPGRIQIAEDCPLRPINACSWSKLFVEKMLADAGGPTDGFSRQTRREWLTDSSATGFGSNCRKVLGLAIGERQVFGPDLRTWRRNADHAIGHPGMPPKRPVRFKPS